jgi:hypothetical protein
VLLAAMAAATRRGEFCALIDASDALDPHSVAAAKIDLDRFLWVRCGDDPSPRHKGIKQKQQGQTRFGPRTSYESEHRVEQVLRATDLLLESGGFGLIILDLADVPPQAARRIPLTTWFRFRRAVEHKPTILLAIEQQAIAGSCSSLLLQLSGPNGTLAMTQDIEQKAPSNCAPDSRGRLSLHERHKPACADLFCGLEIKIQLICSRLERKPAQSVGFASKTAWTG